MRTPISVAALDHGQLSQILCDEGQESEWADNWPCISNNPLEIVGKVQRLITFF